MASAARQTSAQTRRLNLGRRRSQGGVALVMVLWVFTALGIIAAEFARAMRQGATAASTVSEELQSYYIAVSAIHHYMFRAMKKWEGSPVGEAALDPEQLHVIFPLDGLWHEGELWDAEYAIRLTDESGKLPLNLVDEALLSVVLENLGVELDEQAVIIGGILDWTDPDDLVRLHGAERDFYLALEEPYEPRNGPFSSVAELLFVNGITPELYVGSEGYPGLRDIFSVYNRKRRVNVATAPPEVLQVLLNLDEDELQTVQEERLLGQSTGYLASRAENLIVRQYVRGADEELGTVTFDVVGRSSPGAAPARVVATLDLEDLGAGLTVFRWVDREEGAPETAVPVAPAEG